MVGWSGTWMLVWVVATGLATSTQAQQSYSTQSQNYSTRPQSPQYQSPAAESSRYSWQSTQTPSYSTNAPATRPAPSKSRTVNRWDSQASAYVAAAPGMTNSLDEPRLTREQRGAPPVPLGAAPYSSVQPYPPGQSYVAAPNNTAVEPHFPFGRPQDTNVAYNPGQLGATQNPPVGYTPPSAQGIQPPLVASQETAAAHRKSSGTLLGLLFSVALNLFLAWVTWDTHNRYQDLVDDFDELQERRGEPRMESVSRTGLSRRRGRDYDGLPLETSAEPSM